MGRTILPILQTVFPQRSSMAVDRTSCLNRFECVDIHASGTAGTNDTKAPQAAADVTGGLGRVHHGAADGAGGGVVCDQQDSQHDF